MLSPFNLAVGTPRRDALQTSSLFNFFPSVTTPLTPVYGTKAQRRQSISANVIELCSTNTDQKAAIATISIQAAFRGARARRVTDQLNTTAFQCLSISISDISIANVSADSLSPYVICSVFPGERSSGLVSTDQSSNSSSSTNILGVTRYFWSNGGDMLVTGANVFGRIVLNIMSTSSFIFGTDSFVGQAIIDLRDHRSIFVNANARTAEITVPVSVAEFPVHAVHFAYYYIFI